MRAALDELSWSLFDATVSAVPHQVLTRAVRLAAPHRGSLNAVHERMLAAIEQHAAAVNPVSSPRPASRNSAARLR